jgi:hypothetical protein
VKYVKRRRKLFATDPEDAEVRFFSRGPDPPCPPFLRGRYRVHW